MGSSRSALTFAVSGSPRGLPPVAVPCNLRCRFILSCASRPSRVSREHTRPIPLSIEQPSLGFLAPIAASTGEALRGRRPKPASVRPRCFAHPRRLAPPRSCGLISSRCHVRGSLSRDFPSRSAVRARRSPVPSCRCRLCSTLAGSKHGRSPSGLCSDRESVARRGCLGHDDARFPHELLLPRVLLHTPSG